MARKDTKAPSPRAAGSNDGEGSASTKHSRADLIVAFLSGVVVPVALFVFGLYIASSYFDISAVRLDPPEYTIEMTKQPCDGDWYFIEYQSCPDKNRPLLITDADVCGTVEKTELDSGHEYRECRNPSHGIVAYENSHEFEKWSGWRQGGYNQQAWCSEVRRDAEARVGSLIDWQVIKTEEKSKEEFFRRIYYKYYCKGIARWGPIYASKRSSVCGREENSQEKHVAIAGTCADPDNPFEESVRKECGENLVPRYRDGDERAYIVALHESGKLSKFMCTTCEAFIGRTEEYAKCLIASATFGLERGNEDHQRAVKSRMIGLRSTEGQRNELSDKMLDALRSQILHIERQLGGGVE
jgi:hypothetical protein